MSEFLELNQPVEFWELLEKYARIEPLKKETIHFKEGLGRVLAAGVKAREDLPPFSRSTVDGYAVRSRNTAGASESLPAYLKVSGQVEMGQAAELELKPGEAAAVPTGGMLPGGADAVIMVEYTDKVDEETIETTAAVAPGENLVRQGEDIKAGELLLPRGHLLRAQDIGALAGLGIIEVVVFDRPEVTIISTGDELVSPEEEAGPGQIRDINSYALGALLEELGCRVKLTGIVEDSFPALREAVAGNLNSDLIMISGGSSVGVKDLTLEVLNSFGKPGVLLHGVSIKPGKPTILAVINSLPVIGLPGHPASAWTVTNQLLTPIIRSLRGEGLKPLEYEGGESSRSGRMIGGGPGIGVEAVLSRNLASDKGREEYIPVRLLPGEEDGNGAFYLAEPLLGKSSLITTLVQADGLMMIPAGKEGLNSGERVRVRLFGRETGPGSGLFGRERGGNEA